MKSNLAIELKDDGDVDPSEVVTKALSDLNKTVEDRLKAVETKSQERLDKIEAKLNRPAIIKADNDNTNATVETKALNKALREGVSTLDDVERKTLNLGGPSAGGYLVSPEYSKAVIEKLRQYSPLRGLASAMTIGTTEVYIPTLETDADGEGWVTETGNRTATEPEFGQLNIKTYIARAQKPISPNRANPVK